MHATAAKLALIATLLVLFAPSADAQSVHPRCAKSKDKVKCTCFVRNGGHFVAKPGRARRVAVIHSHGQAEGYFQCMVRNGRANG